MALERYTNRATVWKLRTRALALPQRPLLMGIVNVTPDSFSDGGKFLDPEAAIAHARKMVADGADLLDIGGESTRPRAQDVSEEEEISRVLPVIRGLIGEVGVPISIDTRKSRVALAATDAGADIVNDVSGLEADPRMVDVVVSTGAGVCVMHMQGTPQTMQNEPDYDDVVAEVHGYLKGRRESLIAAGIDAACICLDPGIGFGKTCEHNQALLQHCGELHALGAPILVGHSRKSFLGRLLGSDAADRTSATVGVALALAGQGVQVLRVHDVRMVREALQACEFAGGMG